MHNPLRWLKSLIGPHERLRQRIDRRDPLRHSGGAMIESIREGMQRDRTPMEDPNCCDDPEIESVLVRDEGKRRACANCGWTDER